MFVSEEPVTLQLDEDGLTGANADDSRTGENDFGGSTTDSFDLTDAFKVGADQPGTFQFTSGASGAVATLNALGLTSDGATITFALVGDTITGTTAGGTNEVLSLTLTDAGLLSVELSDQIDHADSPDNTETNLPINLGALIEVVDEDGDAVSTSAANIVLNIGDDIPVAILSATPGVSVTVDETTGRQFSGSAAPGDQDDNEVLSTQAITVNNVATNIAAVFSSVSTPSTHLTAQYALAATALFSTIGTAYGADGPGTQDISLILNESLTAPVGAGSTPAVKADFQTTGGQDIYLVKEGDIIIGRVDTDPGAGVTLGRAAFALTVSDDGKIAVVQYEELKHPTGGGSYDEFVDLASGAGSFVQGVLTITDSEGDSVISTPVDIGGAVRFEDDGPGVSANNAVQLDDEAATTTYATAIAGGTGDVSPNTANTTGTVGHAFGVDGGTVSWLTNVGTSGGATGLQYVKSGTSLLIQQDQGSGFVTVITVTMTEATGGYTVTQNRPLFHAAGSTENDQSFTLTYRVTDGDGDTADGTLTINVDDDTGVQFFPDRAIVNNGNSAAATFDLDIDNLLSNNYGADGGTVRFPSSLTGTASGLTSGLVPILYSVSGNGLTLTATAGANTIFTVTLNPATSEYTIDMNGTVDSVQSVSFSSGQYDFSGGNTEWNGFVPSNESLGETVINNNSSDLLLTPEVNGVHDGSINTTASAGGVNGGGGGNNVGSTETFRVDFVTDLRGDPASTGGGDYDTLGKRDHVFDGHYTVNGSTASFASTSGSTVRFTAFDDPDGNNVVGDGGIDPLTSVAITFGGGTQIINLTLPLAPDYTVGGQTFTIVKNVDGSVDISGIVTSTTIGLFTATGYNSVEYSYVSDASFQIGNFGAAVPTTSPVNFSIPVQLVDGDGDTVSSSIGVTLASSGSGIQDRSNDLAGASHVYNASFSQPHIIGSDFVDTITGTTSSNILYGGGGNDSLSGLAGADVLIGGDGNDTISAGAGDGVRDRIIFDATAFGDTDTINDFLVGTGATSDVVDLSELFTVTPVGGTLADHVRMSGTQLQVDADGTQNGVNFVTIANITGFSDGTQSVSILYNNNGTDDTSGTAT